MRRSRVGGARGIAAALVLTVAALLLAALCVRTTAGELIVDGASSLARVVPDDPDAVLDRATTALVRRYGHLDAATFAAVRRAAIAAPLDARPYLILGHQQLLDRQPARALASFEAGQRLDPRQPLIHVLLLDRYLRTGRYADAAPQMSVLTRVAGETGGPIANAFAAMALAPQTRDAVRRTLDTDPALEKSVLIALARAGVPPATILALASPAARADAGHDDSWGPVLVTRLVDQHRYAEARAVWQHIYHLSDAAAAPPVFDDAFRPSPATPPFAWTLVAGSLGAADMKGGGLAIDYYGRDSGDLARQLVVLAPGAWRFSFTVDPGKGDTSSHLDWALACIDQTKPLMTVAINPGPSPRRFSAEVTIPAGCPAQQLTLRGESGDIPTPLSLTVRSPQFTRPAASEARTPS